VDQRTATKRNRRESGFTLIEIMVVVLIMGMMAKIVISNVGAWIPESALDSQANKFRSWMDYLRSEAKIQGKPYSMELDLAGNRMRLVLPPEDKLVTTEDDTLAMTIPLGWTALDDWVRFAGHAVAGRERQTKKKILITFDEHGFTADQSVYFSYDEEDSKMMWTVHIHGLSGTGEIHRKFDGERVPFRATEQSDF
jgi:type II secretion system protein H